MAMTIEQISSADVPESMKTRAIFWRAFGRLFLSSEVTLTADDVQRLRVDINDAIDRRDDDLELLKSMKDGTLARS